MRDYVTVAEIANRLRVSRHTIYSWVSQKRIPYLKVGRLLRFDLHVVEQWLIEQSSPDGQSWLVEEQGSSRIDVRGRGPRPERG